MQLACENLSFIQYPDNCMKVLDRLSFTMQVPGFHAKKIMLQAAQINLPSSAYPSKKRPIHCNSYLVILSGMFTPEAPERIPRNRSLLYK